MMRWDQPKASDLVCIPFPSLSCCKLLFLSPCVFKETSSPCLLESSLLACLCRETVQTSNGDYENDYVILKWRKGRSETRDTRRNSFLQLRTFQSACFCKRSMVGNLLVPLERRRSVQNCRKSGRNELFVVLTACAMQVDRSSVKTHL